MIGYEELRANIDRPDGAFQVSQIASLSDDR